MTTAADVLEVAENYLHRPTFEEPWGSKSNYVPDVTTWYGGEGWRGAWCSVFVARVMAAAGMPLGPDGKGWPWVSNMADALARDGWEIPAHAIGPGTINCYEWGSTAGGLDHTGLATSWVDGGGYFYTLEGNISDEVSTRRRHVSEVPRNFHPPYGSSPSPTPPPAMTGDNMRHFYRFGCLNLVDLDPTGIVVTCWEPHPGGPMTPWQPTGGPNSQPYHFGDGSLDLAMDDNGTVRVWVSSPPYGIVWEQHQPPSGGGWSSWVQRTG